MVSDRMSDVRTAQGHQLECHLALEIFFQKLIYQR